MKFLALLSAFCASWVSAEVNYTVDTDVSSKTIHVRIYVEDPGAKPEFRIPAWCPGWYVLTETQLKITKVKANDTSGDELKIHHVDAQGWTVDNPHEGPVTFTYNVLGDEVGLGSDRVHIDSRTGFINGPAAFMYLKGRIGDPTTLDVIAPEGWDVATAMEKKDGKYRASDYDELIDSPVQMGAMKRVSFKVENIPFEVVFVTGSDKSYPDCEKEAERLKTLSRPAIQLFRTVPFKKYTYVIHSLPGPWGDGLEHRACTVLDVSNTKPLGIDELATHEYFHAWNVKQIRPKILGPFDYTKQCRTHNLWFAEGVTDYYAYLTTYRSGLKDEAWLLKTLSREVKILQNSTTRFRISLEDCCYQTWEHGGFGYFDLSYYNKGMVVGLLLDAAIIDATDGSKTLDDVMRSMFVKYRLPKPGYEEDGILKEVNEISSQDLTFIYNVMLRTTRDLPYDILEKSLGLRVILPGVVYAYTGFSATDNKVTRVGIPQLEKGLGVGDEIVAIRPPNRNGLYEVDIRRGEKEATLTLPITLSTARSFSVERAPFATDKAKQHLAKWLTR